MTNPRSRVLALTTALAALTAPAAFASHAGPAPVMEDAAGDASGFVVESTPLPSAPALDLRSADVNWDHAAKALTVTVKVTDLTAEPPAGATGKTYYVNFTWDNGVRYFLNATQELTGAPTFRLGDFGGTNGARRTLPTVVVTGALDVAKDTVTMTLKASEFGKATGNPKVVEGESVFAVNDFLAQRTVNAVAAALTPTADSAVALDSYPIPAPPQA